MKQIWLIIEWQLPDGAGRVVRVVEGGYYQAVDAAKEINKVFNTAVSVIEAIKPNNIGD